MNIRDFVPPILTRARRKLKIHSSYDAALAVCGAGYAEPDIVSIVVEKSKILRESAMLDLGSLRILAAVGMAADRPEISVLDFGGAAGAHYFTALRAFAGRVRFSEWRIVETPEMVKRARVLEDGTLSFSPDFASAKPDHLDLAFTSGALQYVPDPIGTLDALTQLGARFLMVTRTALSPTTETLVTVQESRLGSNGPGQLPMGFTDRSIRYPATFVPREIFEKTLTERYNVLVRFNEEERAHRVGPHSVNLYGYFCQLK